MNLLWVLQLLINVAFGTTLLLFWWWRRGAVDRGSETRVTELLDLLEHKTGNFERDAAKVRSSVDENLARLIKICDEASAILERNRWQTDKCGPSSEELELRALSQTRKVSETVPTLGELEKTRDRLKEELSLDLRSVLKEQLA